MSFNVQWFNRASEIAPALWDSYFPVPYEGRWWYETLENSGLEDQFTFLYALVSDDSGPVAIAPAFVMNVPIRLVLPPALLPIANVIGRLFPSALYQRTLFIGSPCSDEGRVGMLPHINQASNQLAVLRCIDNVLLLKVKELKATMRVWKDFPAEYKASFANLNSGLFSLISFPGTLAALPNSSKEAYLSALKGSYRNNFKKKLRTSDNAELTAETQQNPDKQTLDEIFALFWQTYEKGDTKFERLNRHFFDLLAAQPCVHFVILREKSGNIVAFMLCYALGEHAVNKFIGIDYHKPKEWFLYFRLWDAAVDWAISQKTTSFQSGQTGYTAKIRLGHALVPMNNHCAHVNPIIHWVYAKVAKTINWDTLDEDLKLYLEAYPEQKPAVV
jgi:Peptidogalycan biosysnthesis/recognition